MDKYTKKHEYRTIKTSVLSIIWIPCPLMKFLLLFPPHIKQGINLTCSAPSSRSSKNDPPVIILSYLCKKTLLLKDQGNFDNICISKEELLGDIAVMPVFCINNTKNTKK